MTKYEKYWVFGMLMMLSITHVEVPTVLNSIANVGCFVIGIGYFIASLWCAIFAKEDAA